MVYLSWLLITSQAMKTLCSDGMCNPLSIGKYVLCGTSGILKRGIKTFIDITHVQQEGMASPDAAENIHALTHVHSMQEYRCTYCIEKCV